MNQQNLRQPTRCRCGIVSLRIFLTLGAALGVTAAAQSRPRLAVVVVVDQMRADYLDRFARLYTGGLARLAQDGVVFDEAYHDHAVTVTSVGHATIATGCYPEHHGIVGNSWYDRPAHRKVYSCEDSTSPVIGDATLPGRSPRRLQRPAIGDWLKQMSPRSKVFAVGEKDYSPILSGGLHPDGVYWYDENNGDFVTSTYYTTRPPDWVGEFNRSGVKDRYFHEGWTKNWPESAYATSHGDAFPNENDGVHTTFPHRFDTTGGHPDSAYYYELPATPFGDELLFDFARTLIQKEGLGADSIPDLLWFDAAATDLIGHGYGPDSPEMIDNLLRLDRTLDSLLGFLESSVGAGNYTVMLTSDHGVLPFPEDLSRQGIVGARILKKDYDTTIANAVARAAADMGIAGKLILSQSGGIFLDTTVALDRGVAPEDLRQQVATRLRQIPFIDEVMTCNELYAPHAVVRGYRDLYQHSFPRTLAPDLAIRLTEYTLVSESKFGTTHGSPFAYDTHVPLIFWGAGVTTGHRVKDRVRTIDAAPTLAVLLGIAPPADVDGVVLKDVLAR
ncbi:MAG: alkaline phosphatase family protein [candidate division Zixibacteria bacterium]|nr:alkaline phosphatase family protein [candidate division Zixibacteria bacterium]